MWRPNMEGAGRVEELADGSDDEAPPTTLAAGSALLATVGDSDSDDDDRVGGQAQQAVAFATAVPPETDAAGIGTAGAATAMLHGALDLDSDDEDWDDDDVLLGAEQEQPAGGGGGIVNDARWALGRVASLPPLTLLWLVVLVGSGALCAFRPHHKGTLAMHWPSVAEEPWRLATTFACLGGEFISFHTLMSVAVITESVASYESLLLYSRPMVFRLLLPLALQQQTGRRELRISTAFLCVLLCGAGCLLASQYWGVRQGLYRKLLLSPIVQSVVQLQPAAIKPLFYSHHWLSHDLTFLMLCVSCWDQPHVPTELGFVPGLPPIARWQLPFALSALHVVLSGSASAVYIEAILASLPTHLVCNVRTQLA
jgi:hypothetical protein